MAIDREKFDDLTFPIVKLYNRIQVEILENQAKRLGMHQADLLDDITGWQAKKIGQINAINEDNIRIINRNVKLASKEIESAFMQIATDGLDTNEDMMQQALRQGAELNEPGPALQSDRVLDILQAYKRQAKNSLNLVNSSLLEHSEQVYRDIIDRTVFQTLTGEKTAQQALRQTVKEWSHKGIPALIDSSNRQWSTEGYIRTVTRTIANDVTNDMQDARFDEYGVDLVEISSHVGARPKCEPYQGKIYSRSGNSSKYPSLSSTSIGEPDGLFGINCHHVQYPYFPGTKSRFNPPNKERNEIAYENSQKQRFLESQIRNSKTEMRMMDALGDTEGASKASDRIKFRQAQMRSFIKSTGRTRRNERELIF